MDENMEVFVARAEKRETLIQMLGSKYVKGSMGEVDKVKKDLEAGKYVLFSGAPCQIAAINRYLGKDYDNFFSIDIVCHGMAGQGLFLHYIKWLEEKHQKRVETYRFRTKTGRDRDGYIADIRFSDTRNKTIIGKYDPYYGSFLDGSIFAERCYSCSLACRERLGDLTIGDWGSRGDSRFYDWRAVSIVLINTEKGQRLWNMTERLFDKTSILLSEEFKTNQQLDHPSDISKYKPELITKMMDGEFEIIAKERKKAVPFGKRFIERMVMLVPFQIRKRTIHIIKDLFGLH